MNSSLETKSRDHNTAELRPKFGIFTTSAIATPALQRVVYNRLARIGGVKLGLDRVSFDAIYIATHHLDITIT